MTCHVSLLGRKFHAVGAEKQKLRFPNLFVRTPGISSCPDVEDRRGVSEYFLQCAVNIYNS